MTLSDFFAHTRDRYRDGDVLSATKYTLADAAFGLQRRVSPDLGQGEFIWEREWDVCLVLDACRVDLMAEVLDEYDWLPDEIDTLWSVGSASPEWVGRTMNAQRWPDELATTQYLTANPFSAKPSERAAEAPPGSLPLANSDFAALEEVWETAWGTEELDVVPPREMTDRTIQAWRQRGRDTQRVVTHYMQPHIPFRSRPEWFGERENLRVFGEGQKEAGKDGWKKVRDGQIDASEWWDAYLDNLRWVLDDVELLVENCEATIAITSDHGNAMGEWGLWSHPAGVAAPVVRRVPWLVVDGVDQETYTPEATVDNGNSGNSERDVDGLLEDLGYV